VTGTRVEESRESATWPSAAPGPGAGIRNASSRPSRCLSALTASRRWLNSWPGICLVAAGTARQGDDLSLTRDDDRGWRAPFDASRHRALPCRHRISVRANVLARRGARRVGHSRAARAAGDRWMGPEGRGPGPAGAPTGGPSCEDDRSDRAVEPERPGLGDDSHQSSAATPEGRPALDRDTATRPRGLRIPQRSERTICAGPRASPSGSRELRERWEFRRTPRPAV